MSLPSQSAAANSSHLATVDLCKTSTFEASECQAALGAKRCSAFCGCNSCFESQAAAMVASMVHAILPRQISRGFPTRKILSSDGYTLEKANFRELCQQDGQFALHQWCPFGRFGAILKIMYLFVVMSIGVAPF